MRASIPILLSLFTLSCAGQKQKADNEEDAFEVKEQKADSIGLLEQKLIDAGLVELQSFIPGILVDLKYSGTDNFLHADVYGDLNRAYLQPEVAEMLKKAYSTLQEKDSSLTFLVFDAVRPRSVQQAMWDTLKMDLFDKPKYVSNPQNGSIHNYGAAIDITLAHRNGETLDMGTPFDFFGEEAEPQLEWKMLAEEKVSAEEIENRKLLRAVMESAGFRQLPSEWWHYNACSREEAKVKWKIIE